MKKETFKNIINDIKQDDFNNKIGLNENIVNNDYEIGICLCIHDSNYDEFNRIEYPYTLLNYKKEIIKQLKKYEKNKWFEEELENLWIEIFLVTRDNEYDTWTDDDMDFCKIEYW